MSSCGYCGVESSSLEHCGACRNVAYCGRDCQSHAWPNHRLECKIGGPFRKNLFKGLCQEIPVAIRRDHSERVLLYLRDKLPNARELLSSGLHSVLEQIKSDHDPSKCTTQGCWLCPAITEVVDEISAFAAKGTHCRAMTKLRTVIAQGQGHICYYPGAMLGLSQPIAAITAAESSVTHLVCVSSFEVDTIERMHKVKRGDTEAFCSLIQQELQGSPLILKATLISDSRLDKDSNDLGPIRIEYELQLRGEKPSLRLVYYVNEDFHAFWPPEVEDGSITVLCGSKTCLPLWEQEEGGWVGELKRRSLPSTVFLSDSISVCEPPLLFFFLAAAEGGSGSHPLPQSVIEDHLSEGFVKPLMTTLPLLSVTEDLIAHSKKSGQSGGYLSQETFNVRVLCAWRLSDVLNLAAKAVQAVLDESSTRSKRMKDARILDDARRRYREFLCQEFGAVVRVDGFKKLPALNTMASTLRHILTHESAQSIQASLPEWKAQEIRLLRIAVGLEG